MSTATFDKLLYLETLKSAGIPDEQARAHAHALDEAMRDAVATKADVARLEGVIRETELRLKHDLTLRLGAMLAAAVAIVAALMKLH